MNNSNTKQNETFKPVIVRDTFGREFVIGGVWKWGPGFEKSEEEKPLSELFEIA